MPNTLLAPLVDLAVTSVPAGPDARFERAGKIGRSYIWYRRDPNLDPILLLDVLLLTNHQITQSALPSSTHLLDHHTEDLLQGQDPTTQVHICWRTNPQELPNLHLETWPSPVLNLLLVQPDTLLSPGYIKLPVDLLGRAHLDPSQRLCLAVQTQASLEQVRTRGWQVGDVLDCMDTVNKWCVARVARREGDRVYIHYEGWGDKWNEWIECGSERLAPYRTHTSEQQSTAPKASGNAVRLGRKNVGMVMQRVEKLGEVVEKGWKEWEEVELGFIQGESVDVLKKLLDAVIDDGAIVELTLGYCKRMTELIAMMLNQCPKYVSSSVLEALLALFNGDETCRRFYNRHGVALEEESHDGPFAKRRIDGRETLASVYLIENINHFGRLGGFDAMLHRIFAENGVDNDRVETQQASCMALEAVTMFVQIIEACKPHLDEGWFEWFAEELATRVKLRLRHLSALDIKSLSRSMLNRILHEITVVFGWIFESDSNVEWIRLDLLHQMIVSPFLAPRLLGLSELLVLLEQIDANETQQQPPLQVDQLIEWIESRNLLSALLGSSASSHQEVLKRIPPLLIFLARHHALQDAHIEAFWETQRGQHEVVVRVVYDAICDLLPCLNPAQLDALFERIAAIPLEEYTDYLLHFVSCFTSSAIAATSDTRDKWYGLNLFWELIAQDTVFASEATNMLMEQLGTSACASQRLVYLNRCVDTLERGGIAVAPCLRLARAILGLFPSDRHSSPTSRKSFSRGDSLSVEQLIMRLQQERHLLELLVNSFVKYRDCPQGRCSPRAQIRQRLNFLEFLLSHSSLTLERSSFGVLWDVLVLNHPELSSVSVPNSASSCDTDRSADRGSFFVWLTRALDQRSFSPELARHIFDAMCLDETRLQHIAASSYGYACFEFFFFYINRIAEAIQGQGLHLSVSRLSDLQGLDHLWTIAMHTKDEQIERASHRLLIRLHIYVERRAASPSKNVVQSLIRQCLQFMAKRSEPAIRLLTEFLACLRAGRAVPPLPNESSPSWLAVDPDESGSERVIRVAIYRQNDEKSWPDVSIAVDPATSTIGMVRDRLGQFLHLSSRHIRLALRGRFINAHQHDHVLLASVLPQQAHPSQNCDLECMVLLQGSEPKYVRPGPSSDSLHHVAQNEVDSDDDRTRESFQRRLHECFSYAEQLLVKDEATMESLLRLLQDNCSLSSFQSQLWRLITSLPPNLALVRQFEKTILEEEFHSATWEKLIPAAGEGHESRLLYVLKVISISPGNHPVFECRNALRALQSAWMVIDLESKWYDSTLGEYSLAMMLDLQLRISVNVGFHLSESTTGANYVHKLLLSLKKVLFKCASNEDGLAEGKSVHGDTNEGGDDSQHRYGIRDKIVYSGFGLIALALSCGVEELPSDMLETLLLNGFSVQQDVECKSFTASLYELCGASNKAGDDIFKWMESQVLQKRARGRQFFSLLAQLLEDSFSSRSQRKIDIAPLLFALHEQLMDHSTDDASVEGVLRTMAVILSNNHSSELGNQLDAVGVSQYITQQLMLWMKSKPGSLLNAGFCFLQSLIDSSSEAQTSCIRMLLRQHREAIVDVPEGSTRERAYATGFQVQPEPQLLKSKTGYVGLFNPGCICYMNALLQQLFMHNSFRDAVLHLKLLPSKHEEESPNDPEGTYRVPEEDLELNFLYQLQLLFAHLLLSDMPYYDSQLFARVFKDLDGNPTDVTIQKDTNEFLNLLFDRIDTLIGNSADSPTRVFGGQFSNQLICQRGGHVREREEPFYCVTLSIKNQATLQDSLRDFVRGEMLQGDNAYHCESCGEKVDTLKRVLLKQLPSTLIMHLKRFELDYETLEMVKLNDGCEFPRELDLFPFSTEVQQKQQPREYFRYRLSGVLVHTGSMNAGHYYSFIAEPEAPHRWLEFNDTVVTPFDVDSRLSEECFGGEPAECETKEESQVAGVRWVVNQRRRNAYLLFYEREPSRSVARSPPAWLTNLVQTQNQRYWRDRFLFSPGYYTFLSRWLTHHTSNQGTPLISRLVTLMLLDVVCRSSRSQTAIFDWMDLLRQLETSPTSTVEPWLLNLSAQAPRWTLELLLEAPCDETRLAIAMLIIREMQQLPWTSSSPLVQQLVAQIIDLAPYFRVFGVIFQILFAFALKHSDAALYLIRAGTIRRLLTMYFETKNNHRCVLDYIHDDSKLREPVDSKYVWALLRKLMEHPQLSEDTLEKFVQSSILTDLMAEANTALRGIHLGGVFQELVRNSVSRSEHLVVSLVDAMESRDSWELRPFLRILAALVSPSLDDEVQEWRIELVMSSWLTIVRMHQRYWYCTQMAIEHVLRLGSAFPMVANWLRSNAQQHVTWMLPWLEAHPSAPGNSRAQDTTSLCLYKEGFADSRSRSSVQVYGRSSKQKRMDLQALLQDQLDELDDALDQSDEDLEERIFNVGQWIDVLDRTKRWCPAVCKRTSLTQVFVHYHGWTEKWDEWLPRASSRIAPIGLHTGFSPDDPLLKVSASS